MTWLGIVVIAWFCEACGVEVALRDSDLPDGSANIHDEPHPCPHCETLPGGH